MAPNRPQWTEIAENLKRCRKAAGFTSAEALAFAAGVSPATVKNIERGSSTGRNPKLETLKSLAATCGVDVSAITGTAGVDEARRRVEAYALSDDGLALKPTGDEKKWLSELGLSWLDGEPSDDGYTHMLLGLRKRRSRSP